jgi:hypothetical protein
LRTYRTINTYDIWGSRRLFGKARNLKEDFLAEGLKDNLLLDSKKLRSQNFKREKEFLNFKERSK